MTLVTFGAMVPTAMEAAMRLSAKGIELELIDLRTLAPLDLPAVIASVKRTRRLLVAEMGWLKFGAAAEVIAAVCEQIGPQLQARPRRVGWPHSFVPTSSALEQAFYPTAETLIVTALDCMSERG